MLDDAIGGLLPAAVAVALSPIPIVAVVVVLGAPRARTAGPAFALGWIAGLLAVSVVVVLLVGERERSRQRRPGRQLAQARHRDPVPPDGRQAVDEAAAGPARSPRLPGWMATIDSATPPRAALLGAALSGANPKNLALTLTAAASIAEAGLDTARHGDRRRRVHRAGIDHRRRRGALLPRRRGDRAARPLAAVKQFMADNNAVIMMVVLLLLGAKLLGDGLAGLWQ